MTYNEDVSEEEYVALNEAITQASVGSIVTKWVMVMEFIGDDGERYLESRTSEGCSMWDELGLLRYRTRFAELGIDRPSE